MTVLQQIAGATSIPWGRVTSFGHGHTINLTDVEGFAGVWMVNDHLLTSGDSPLYEDVFEERVNLLWMIPVTQEEYEFLKEFPMEKIFDLKLSRDLTVFDGNTKLPMDLLKGLL